MLQTGQVLFRRLSANFAVVLPFKDSQGGTSTLELSGLSKDTALRSNVASSKLHFGEASCLMSLAKSYRYLS
jgi:hypothetical protein